jgi:propionate CoA-transferase
MPLNERKIIARRASFALTPGKVVNLGIGLPEGVASVAGEEGQLPYITLTTEPGVFGGLPSSGKDFGPALNAAALVEMNQQVRVKRLVILQKTCSLTEHIHYQIPLV